MHLRIIAVIGAAVITGQVKAQSLLGSLTINSSPLITVSSLSDYENGVAVTDQTLTITTNAAMNWALKVRAAGNLDYTGNQIALSHIGMRVTNMPGAPPEIMLSTSDQDIANGTSAAVLQTIPVEIRYRLAGGNGIPGPAGDYVANLTFTLTMVNL